MANTISTSFCFGQNSLVLQGGFKEVVVDPEKYNEKLETKYYEVILQRLYMLRLEGGKHN